MIKLTKKYIFLSYVYLFICQLIGFVYTLNEIYYAMILTKTTQEMIPGISPYAWPFFIIRLFAIPYLNFWRNIIPPIIIIPKLLVADFLALNFLLIIVPKILINCENYFYSLYLKSIYIGYVKN